MRIIRVALLGFGNAGKAFGELLIKNEQRMKEELDVKILVTGVVTGTRGAIIDEEGINLRKVIDDLTETGRFSKDTKGLCNMTTKEVIQEANYDVAIEITPLDVFTGQPALEHIIMAMKRKKHVITANKGPLAHEGKYLKALSKSQNIQFFHETTVMDGTPIFNLVEETLPFCKIQEIHGILNTTTNFVLEEMAKGKTFDEAMTEGRKRGFVEADPSLDIDGWDAAAKLMALMNVLMETNLKPQDIHRTGIGNVTAEDIAAASNEGKVIKLICKGRFEGGKPVGIVEPVSIPLKDAYASISGTSSVVSLVTDLMGTVTITEHDPEIEQTGYGIFSDLIRLIKKTQ
ncbi:MAG: hypothetical protein JXR88_17835 [Clostridia bacterium]|nr:hypothetical protein [Clostridia bacterium]